MKKTSPGMTLRLFGLFSIRPTEPTASGACSRAMASMRSIIRAAPTSAFLRSRIGVAPVWASWPVTVTSYQRMPWTPWTTPIMRLFVFEDRALLDVQFEHRAEFTRAGVFAAAIADALQFVAECLAVAVGARIGVSPA